MRRRRLQGLWPGPFALGVLTPIVISALIACAIVVAALLLVVTLPLWFPFVLRRMRRSRRGQPEVPGRPAPTE